MKPTINFCPVCRGPVGQNRERSVERLAERLRAAYAMRTGGEAAYVTLRPWAEADKVTRDRWLDQAETAIAALDVR